jgi:hypothetical protein
VGTSVSLKILSVGYATRMRSFLLNILLLLRHSLCNFTEKLHKCGLQPNGMSLSVAQSFATEIL